MKVFAISDPHLSFTANKPMSIFGAVWENHWDAIESDWSAKVSEDDVVLIAGDVSWGMTLDEAIEDLKTIGALPGKKIYIRGNHDYWWSSISKIRAALPENSFCIQNDAMKIGKYVFAGSRGWSIPELGAAASPEDEKILKREVIRMEMSLKCAEKIRTDGDMLIAMIHFPPFDSRFSSSVFTELFNRYSVEKVVYGHLHGSKARTETYLKRGETEYYLTSCDKLGNKLRLIASDTVGDGV